LNEVGFASNFSEGQYTLLRCQDQQSINQSKVGYFEV